MADDSRSTPRAQLCALTYSELSELSKRLLDFADDILNPALRADLHLTAGAVSDVASIKFGVADIAGKPSHHADDLVEFAANTKTHDAIVALIGELLALIGREAP